jgi:GT2 family glycosyltransferase/glycosyltransferase involved in cell wall biosynthesis
VSARSLAVSTLRRSAVSQNVVIRRSARLALKAIRRVRARPPRRATRAAAPPVLSTDQDAGSTLATRLLQRPTITVAIPIHNAANALERCLRSVIEHTNLPYDLLLLDDASTDPAVDRLLDRAAAYDHVEVVRLATNQGFTATANTALARTGGDVVLLNSDTQVGPGWLQGLIIAAHQSGSVATATPLSDNAGAFSAPEVGHANAAPHGLDAGAISDLVRRGSQHRYPRVPTGHGFCLYLRRRALEYVGHFDEQSFPRGYGEENDFCLRASAAGFEHVLDDATYVRHERSASFGGEKDALLRAGRAALDTLHPQYTQLVRNFMADAVVERARDDVRRSLGSASAGWRARPRLLFVLHEGTGGTPATNLDLMRALSPDVDCLTLTAHNKSLELHALRGERLELVRKISLERAWRVTDIARPDYRDALAAILVEQAIDLVHVRHLMGHTLELPALCRAMGVPVVLSFHDFYLSCPTVHLLDEQDRFCGGRCTPGPGACRMSNRRTQDVPPLKHAWVHEWRRHVDAMFDHVDTFVTTSQASRHVMERSLPSLRLRPFHVIPHGRDIPRSDTVAVPPSPSQRIRILIAGNIGVHKGAQLIRDMWTLDRGERLDLHFLGRTPPELYDVGFHHGEYARADFPRLAAEIAPSFIGVFAIWAETYSHTLTEAWAVGVPVLASDIGVLRERVLETGAGWLVSVSDPQTAYEQILQAAADGEAYQERRRAAGVAVDRSVHDMSDDYRSIYQSLLRPRTWQAAPQP